jgi:hypothetical protein
MTNDQIIHLLETLKTDVLNSLQANGSGAGGQAAKQITITTDGNTAQLQLPGYLQLLETGRGPTPKDAVAGNPPMIQRIQQWCKEKGIPDKAAWAIKKSIDKKGFKGKPGILSGPLGNDNINLRLNAVMESIAAALNEEVLSTIDGL